MSFFYLGPLGKAEIVSNGARVPAGLAHGMAAAQAVVAAANGEADGIRREARAQGYADGLAQGQAALAQVIAEAHMRAGRHAFEMQPLLADCAVQAVRMLMEEADPALLIRRAVERVRERLGDSDGLTLKVAPSRLEGGQHAAGALMQRYGATLPVRVVADPALGMYDWIIESPLGRAEVRGDAQLAQLRQLISGALASVEAAAGMDDAGDARDAGNAERAS